MVLSQNEKAILLYLQKNATAYASTPTQEFNYIWQGAGLTKKDAQLALDKLVKKKMITGKPSDKKTAEQRELFGNIYRLTPKGTLHTFHTTKTIIITIGIAITGLIGSAITIYQYLQ